MSAASRSSSSFMVDSISGIWNDENITKKPVLANADYSILRRIQDGQESTCKIQGRAMLGDQIIEAKTPF